jgi:hypothetical protein
MLGRRIDADLGEHDAYRRNHLRRVTDASRVATNAKEWVRPSFRQHTKAGYPPPVAAQTEKRWLRVGTSWRLAVTSAVPPGNTGLGRSTIHIVATGERLHRR